MNCQTDVAAAHFHNFRCSFRRQAGTNSRGYVSLEQCDNGCAVQFADGQRTAMSKLGVLIGCQVVRCPTHIDPNNHFWLECELHFVIDICLLFEVLEEPGKNIYLQFAVRIYLENSPQRYCIANMKFCLDVPRTGKISPGNHGSQQSMSGRSVFNDILCRRASYSVQAII